MKLTKDVIPDIIPRRKTPAAEQPMELIPDAIEFAENPEPRCPCVLVLDVSYSMDGRKIRQLNKGLAKFSKEIKKDTLASLRTEVAIITFSDQARIVQDFVTADNFRPKKLRTEGGTNISKGINLALDSLEKRKSLYKESSIEYYRPWLFLITDGEPTEAQRTTRSTSKRLKKADSNKEVAAFSVAVEGANLRILTDISPRTPLQLKGLDFSSMFVWLSQSMSQVSHSQPGQNITLNTQGISKWAII